MICRNFSTPAPDVMAARTRSVAAGRSGSIPLSITIRAASSTESEVSAAGPRPFSVSIDSTISSALPTARPSGASMLVSSASVRTPASSPVATSDSASARASASRLHEGAVAALHVEHEPADPLGDFLAHDRRGDQRNAFDRGGDVAQGIELPIRGSDFRGLPDQRAADRGDRAPQLVERKGGAESGNRLELVEGAAGVPEPASRHHRHVGAARGRQRRQDDRGLVPDAAGAVLVDGDTRQARILHPDTRTDHRVGQAGGLVGGHPAQHDGHQQG